MSDIKTALQAEIEKMESACDEIPFGLDEEDEQCLWVMREGLKQITQRDAQIARLTTERDALREEKIGKNSNTRDAADIYFQLVEECEIPPGGSLVQYVDGLKEQIAELAKQKPIGRVDLGEYDDCGTHPDATVVCLHEYADWENFQDGTELFTRAAPPAPLSCEWSYDDTDHYWKSVCGGTWVFNDGGPRENEVNFCQCCGNSVVINDGSVEE